MASPDNHQRAHSIHLTPETVNAHMRAAHRMRAEYLSNAVAALGTTLTTLPVRLVALLRGPRSAAPLRWQGVRQG